MAGSIDESDAARTADSACPDETGGGKSARRGSGTDASTDENQMDGGASPATRKYPGPCRVECYSDSSQNGKYPDSSFDYSYDDTERVVKVQYHDCAEEYTYNTEGMLEEKKTKCYIPYANQQVVEDIFYAYNENADLSRVERIVPGDSGTIMAPSTPQPASLDAWKYEYGENGAKIGMEYFVLGYAKVLESEGYSFGQGLPRRDRTLAKIGYIYDESGRLLALEVHQPGSSTVCSWELDDSVACGQPFFRLYLFLSYLQDRDWISDGRLWYFYDQEGRVRRVEWDAGADRIPDAVAVYGYDSRGDLRSRERDLDADGVVDISWEYSYDRHGNLLEEVKVDLRNQETPVKTTTLYTYECW